MSTGRSSGRIITFYSYKGGTGRSMALANVAWVLASAGKSVLVIDWDLEAPGLHRYFRPFLIDKELTSSDGLIDFIIHYADTVVSKPPINSAPTREDWYVEYADITDYALSLNFGEFPPGGKIDFVPAGRQGTTYATRVNTFDWQKFYTRLGGETFLEASKGFMRKYDYVLIDSRTGVSDTSGICTVQMPDSLVVCFTLNNQSIEGTAAVAQSAIKERAEFIKKLKERGGPHAPLPSDEREFLVLPIPMRAELNEKERLDRRRKFAKRRFNSLLSHIPSAQRDAYWGDVQVPYIPYYAFEELLSPFIDDPADKLSVLRAMVQICDYLTDSEVSKFDLIISSKKKEEVLRKFALAPDEEESAEAKPAQADATLKKQLEQADEFFAQLTEDEKGAARRLWTRLVRVPRDDERALNSGVVVPLDDLDPTVLHLARELTEAKLLVINKDDLTGEATVGVANEELLRQWPQLIAWINKDREFLIWRQKLSEHIAQWEKDKRSRLSLLGVSAALRAQERLRERPADLTSVEKDYIERSTRQRLLLLGASAVAACVVVAALLVFWVYNKRQAQARVATRLSSAVEQFNVDDPKADLDLGMLLAVESLRVSGDVKAERLLRENITKFPLSVANLHHDTRVDSVTFSGDGGRLTTVSGAFSGSMDSSTNDSQKLARVWDISSGQELARLSLDPAAQDFAVNSDGRYVAVTGTERAENATVFKVLLYDLSAPDSQPVKVNSHSETISAMTFGPSPGPDGRILLATASEDGTVHVFDVSGMKQLATLTYSSAVISLAFGSSRYLVTGTDDNRINTCDLNALGARGGSLELDGNILMVASSPNDKYMAALLLKVPRAREALLMIRPIKDSTDVPLGVSNLNDLTFSSDSHYVAAAGEDGLGHIFSLADGKAADGKTEVIKIASLRHGSAINKMIFSGDGKYVATIGHDKVARVWETATGHESFRLTLEGEVNDLAFSPDGQYVAVASADRTARVWRVTGSGGSDVAAEACKRLSRNLTPQEWSRYFDDQPYRKTCENLP